MNLPFPRHWHRASGTAPIVLRGDVPPWLMQQSHVRRVLFAVIVAALGAWWLLLVTLFQ